VQLSHAVWITFGEGALDRVNGVQLLHSIWRLQESIDLDEWRHILYKANEWVLKYVAQAAVAVVDESDQIVESATNADSNKNTNKKKKKAKKIPASVQHEAAFVLDFDRIYKFHSKFKTEPTTPTTVDKRSLLGKMQAPILTRWWYVGAGSSYAFDYYLVLFYACQTVINMYSSTTTPNMIASSLFSMMKDQETFIDLVLIRCFHKAYVNRHFDWLQSSNDLSGHLGFQAHHIAVRLHLMDCDLRNIMSGHLMEHYTEAVENWTDGTIDKANGERARHLNKLKMFVTSAHESLFKHFPRWLNSSLMPAALLSEAPTAQVVAAIMLDRDMPTFESHPTVRNEVRLSGKILYKSDVHKVDINLKGFNRFLRG